MSVFISTVWGRRLVLGWVFLCQIAPIFDKDLITHRDLDSLRPATFQGMTPGSTTQKEIQKQFEGRNIQRQSTHWDLDVGPPFRTVELYFDPGKVLTHVHAVLATPRPLDVVKDELRLENATGTKMLDADRQPYRYFPKRGLRLSASALPARHVKMIGLYPLSSSDLLRLLDGPEELEFYQALQSRGCLDRPGKVRLLEWYLRGGRVDEASKVINDVSAADEFHHSLVLARQNLWTGESIDIDELAKHIDSPKPLVAASRKIALARLCAFPQVGEPVRASELIADAMKTLTPQLQTKHVIEARRLLLEAHVVMLQAISSGTWDKKEQRLEEWLANTESLIRAADNPKTSPLTRIQTIRRVLDALANIDFEFPYQRWEQLAQSATRQVESHFGDNKTELQTNFAKSEFALESARIQRQLAQLARSRGDLDKALQRAMASRETLLSVQHEFWIRRREIEQKETQYLLGAVHALGKNDHVAAVRWYEKVEEDLDKIDPETHAPGSVGDRLVSIGVSYWTIGQKEKALELTERGRLRIDALVKSGRLPDSSLATAFQNLSIMHASLGHDERSARYTELSRNLTRDLRR